MTTTASALALTSTDTPVVTLGHLRNSVEQVALSAAGIGVIPPPETLLGLNYVRAHAEIAEILHTRLARS